MKPILLIALLTCSSAFAQNQRAGQGSPYASAPSSAHGNAAIRGGGPPANDDCANATVIALATNCYNPTEGDNTNATAVGPDPSCDDPGANTLDVWYTFTTGSTGATAITVVPSAAMTDWEYVLYEGACDGSEVVCRILPVQGQQEALAPATQYWVRVYTNPDYGTPGPFTLCIQDLDLVSPPANDDCANAVPAPLAIGSSVTFTGDATYALNAEGLPFNSIWNAFTTSEAADVHVALCGTTSSMGFTWLALYLSCPANVEDRIWPGSYSNCPNGLADLCYGNLPAGTYYYAVPNALSPGGYSVVVSAETAGSSSPVNDDCAGAIALSAGTWCNPATFSPTCASASPPAGGCLEGLANPEDDVWYSFIATQAEMSLGILPHSVQFGPIIEVYAGSCGALTSLACSNGFEGDTLEINMNALVPGNTYFVQVYNGYISTLNAQAGYGLCLVEGLGINIGVTERVAGSDALIFPNPSTGVVTVQLPEHVKPRTFAVMDAMGRSVITEPTTNSGPLTIDLSSLDKGVYVVRVNTDSGTQLSQRVVKE